MLQRTQIALPLLAVLICSWAAVSVHATSVVYTVDDDRVSVALMLNFYQNATAMPALNGTFTGASAEDLASSLEESLREKVDGASVSSVTGELVSSADWVNATIRFEITDISSREGSLVTFNCSWIPFNVSRDLRIGNVSYNMIGPTYIKPAFEDYVNFDQPPLNETILSVTYLSVDQETGRLDALNQAGNSTLLDFSRLVMGFEHWQNRYNVTEGSTSWSYNPEPAVDLKMVVSPREGVPFVSRAFYRYNATVTVAGVAQAQGDMITLQGQGGTEPLLMLAVIVVAFAVAVVSSWSYRSRRKQLIRRRK